MLTPEFQDKTKQAFEAEIERRARKAYEVWALYVTSPIPWEQRTETGKDRWKAIARAMCDEIAMVGEGMAHADLRVL